MSAEHAVRATSDCTDSEVRSALIESLQQADGCALCALLRRLEHLHLVKFATVSLEQKWRRLEFYANRGLCNWHFWELRRSFWGADLARTSLDILELLPASLDLAAVCAGAWPHASPLHGDGCWVCRELTRDEAALLSQAARLTEDRPLRDAYARAQGNAVIIGRGAAILLRYRVAALHLRLTAPLRVRTQRTRQLEPALDAAMAEAKCNEMDRARARYVRYFFGENVTDPTAYHATLNTGELRIEEAAGMVADLVARRARAAISPAGSLNDGTVGIIALASQLGSRETDLARELTRRLHLKLWDRETLMQAVGIPGASDSDLTNLEPKSFEALGNIVKEIRQHGGALLVGRGGAAFLRSEPGALRVKLVAPLAERVRRVAEYRWLDEAAARAAVLESDARRKVFYTKYFGIDWDQTTHFDMVVNTAMLGPSTVDLVAQAAKLKWSARPAESMSGSLAVGTVPGSS